MNKNEASMVRWVVKEIRTLVVLHAWISGRSATPSIEGPEHCAKIVAKLETSNPFPEEALKEQPRNPHAD